jgi:hypothetical protein
VLFEALGGMGVTLTDWKEFVECKWHSVYKKIVYRKLNCKRTPEMLTEFENFIKVRFAKMFYWSIAICGQALQDQDEQVVLQ